jgi:hypothetical protein
MNQTKNIVRLAFVTLGITAAGTVHAQQSPYYIGASQAFTHDSNLFRLADGATLPVGAVSRSDTISTTSLLAGINQPIGRQRLFGDVAIRHNRFADNDQLDNTGYGVGLGIDWATVNQLSGTVSYTASQTLSSFADGVGSITEPNKERSQQFLARGRLGGESLLAVEATYIFRKRDYSATTPAAQANEFDQNSLGLGLLYRPSGLLTLGAGVRHTRGSFDAAADDFDRNDLDLTAVWVPTGLSKVAARLSYSKEDHDVTTIRDFSGVTGSLTWEYKPTGKLTFITDLIRDTGAEASFDGYTFNNTNPAGNNSQITSAARLRAHWDATAKIGVDAGARYARRKLLGGGDDKTGTLTLAANYLAMRNIMLGCQLGHEKRGGATSYTANTAGCSAQVTLR